MKSIHVRNIFQVVIPLQAPPNSLSVVSQLLTSGDEFGFAVVDVISKSKYEYKVHIHNASYGTKTNPVQNCLAWAKRNPISFQHDKDTQAILGIILRLKVQQGFFDFRRIAKQNIQLKVGCLTDAVPSNKIASSEIVQLLPKKRKGQYDIEVVIPLEWHDESYNMTQDLHGLEASIDNSPDIVYHSSDGYSSSPEHSYMTTFNHSVSVYEDSHQLELSLVNEAPTGMFNTTSNNSNTNEQYMVLYNGNAEVIGNFRALNFYKASDINIKEDIRLISEFADARDVLLRIDGVDYKFKKGISQTVNRRFVGYIAQQVESVVPDAVQLIDGILHVDYESLIPYLSESIRANFSDIKNTQAKTERIEKIVDEMYQQFLKQDKPHSTPQTSKGTAKSTPTRRSRAFSWKIIAATVLTTALVAIIAAVLFFSLSTDDPRTPPISEPTDNEYQRRALEEFFWATNGTNWKRNDGWMTNTSICGWYGIFACGEYISLSLSNNNLQGTLPESFGTLPFYYLQLSNNKIEGPLPYSFSRLHQLSVLNMSRNSLTRVNLKDMFQLETLAVLDLSYNNIKNGKVEVGPSRTLTKVDLSHNQFFGYLPDLSATWLEFFNVGYNNFEGPMPVIPFTMRFLSLESNNFYGEIWRLHRVSLFEVNLANNQFEGEVPFEDDELPRMTYLNVSNNKFSSVKAINANLTDDMICDASNVDFQCPIPDWLVTRCSAKCQ